jgi:hypothetical protein
MRWLLVLAVVFAARPADACGFFRMSDRERKLDIGWLINSASIEKDGKRLAALYLDIEAKTGLRVVTSKTVIYDIRGDKVLRYGAAVGRVDGDKVTFGKKTYAIDLQRNAKPQHEGLADYQLVVKRGDDVIVEADHASALCAAMKRGDDEDADKQEIRRRIIYYLEWRELGM